MPVFSIPSWEVSETIIEYLEDISDTNGRASDILKKMNAIVRTIAGTPRREGVFPVFLDLTDDEAEQFEMVVEGLEVEDEDAGDRLGIKSSYTSGPRI